MAGRVVQKVLSLLAIHPTLFINPYCRISGDSHCFSISDLRSLNATLEGRLSTPSVPNFDHCVDPACFSQDARINSGGVQYLNFESGFGMGGESNGSDSTAGSERFRTPSLVVEAENVDDVVAGVNFARTHHLRLRIKNTGHDYLGRSSDVGSFTIRTTKLKGTEFVERFVPAFAPVGTVGIKAVIAGSGTSVMELYAAADKHNVLLAGGTTRTVGAAGGWVTGGGHGPLAPLLGLGVDNVLEYTVVIATGAILKASPYSHPRLFKSLNGGGGAFGIVVSVVFRAHEVTSGFVGAFGEFDVKTSAKNHSESWKELNREWIKAQLSLAAAGFAGYSYIRTVAHSPFAYILPSNDLELAKSAWKPFIDFVEAHEDLYINMKWVEENRFYNLWEGDFTRALQSLDEVGINLLVGGRLIPQTTVESNSDSIADFISSSPSPSIVHLVAGGAVAAASGEHTSVNPLWRQTLLHIDLPVTWGTKATYAQVKGVESYLTKKTLELGAISRFENGQQACYPSEADYNEVDWQGVWYGDSYKELLATKQIYDPLGVFTARKAVGSEIVGW